MLAAIVKLWRLLLVATTLARRIVDKVASVLADMALGLWAIKAEYV
jgi:hypothetical protein